MPAGQQPEAAGQNEKTEIELEEHANTPITHLPSEQKVELAGGETDPCFLERGDEEELEESLRLVPKIVRELVSIDDDPTLPTITFRFFVLSTTFAALGAIITQVAWFRTTAASYSMFFVQIVSYWLGNLMARTLPHKDVSLCGLFKFSLNPGPFSIKEHVLIVIG
ncbi:OPT super, partial [Linnemannia gamsii]